MQRQVQWAVNQILETFTDISEQRALELVQDCHVRICTDFPINPGFRDIPLTQFTRSYPLLQAEVSVRSGALYATNESFQDMELFHGASKDKTDPMWRVRAPGSPMGFCVEGSSITLDSPYGFVPAGGYPVLRIQVLLCPELGINDLLPEAVKNPQVYVEFACWKWASRKKPEMSAFYANLFNQEVTELAAGMRNRLRHQTQYHTPEIASYSGVV